MFPSKEEGEDVLLIVHDDQGCFINVGSLEIERHESSSFRRAAVGRRAYHPTYKSSTSTSLLAREQHGIMQSFRALSALFRTESAWSGSPAITRVMHDPHTPSPQEIGTFIKYRSPTVPVRWSCRPVSTGAGCCARAALRTHESPRQAARTAKSTRDGFAPRASPPLRPPLAPNS